MARHEKAGLHSCREGSIGHAEEGHLPLVLGQLTSLRDLEFRCSFTWDNAKAGMLTTYALLLGGKPSKFTECSTNIIGLKLRFGALCQNWNPFLCATKPLKVTRYYHHDDGERI